MIPGLYALDWIPSFAPIPLHHCFFGAHVVIGWVALGEEVHGASGPVGAETAGLDACEVDVLFWFYFVGEKFGEAFDGPFRGAVDDPPLGF